MIRIKGNKQIEITLDELEEKAQVYDETVLDIGTGDGRFVYKNALENPGKLFIGIDPSATQLEVYSKKAARKKIHNAVFLVGSIELFPIDRQVADNIYIILPWGSLLKTVSEPERETVLKLHDALNPDGNLTIIFGYDPQAEPSETERLELGEIDQNFIDNKVIPGFTFKEDGFRYFRLQQQKQLKREELREFESTWSKKLSFGSDRPIFQLIFKRC